MRTIPARHPRSSPRGDYPVECSICGVPWLRSRMVRDIDGRLRCPDDQKGLELAGLARRDVATAQRAAAVLSRHRRREGTIRVEVYPEVRVLEPADGDQVLVGLPVTWRGECTDPVTRVELYFGHPALGTFRGRAPLLVGTAVPVGGLWAVELAAGPPEETVGAVELYALGSGGGECVSRKVSLEVA